MQWIKRILALGLLALLVGCTGGGDNAGCPTGSTCTTSAGTTTGATTTTTTTGGTTTTTTAPPAVPTMALVLTDSAGTVLSTNSITSGALFYAKVTLLDAAGAPVPNALVTLSTDPKVGTLASTTVLTDISGIAKTQISPASITGTGAASLGATATVAGQALTGQLAYQTSAANVVIAALAPAPASITALQTSSVTANATVNGAPATSGQVSITFTAACGSFSPATVLTSSTGSATSTYQSTAACSGSVQISANAAGATTVTSAITVAAAQAANILYDSATVTSLVVSSASSGAKQSTVSFKVVDAGGGGMSNQSVTLTLDPQSSAAGVQFSTGGGLTTAAQVVTTDALGFASVIIQSGSLPTPVIVTGTLSPTMIASSSGIVVTSGKASQNGSSLSVDKASLEGLYVDGVQAQLTMRVSDRQGNPIPAGTAVTFVASHGTIQGSCLTGATSACSVTYTTSGTPRPSSGFAVILAYMDGEESFVDLNGNNLWDAGETFEDMGTVFRDDNLNLLSDAGEQTYPGGMVGTIACPPATDPTSPSAANTCDGVWSSSIRVRRLTKIGLASSAASFTLMTVPSLDGFMVRIGDSVNPAVNMPTGTTVTATLAASGPVGSACGVTNVSPNVVENVPTAGDFRVFLNGLAGCAGAKIDVNVKTPSGAITTGRVSIP